jgi:hypothetical protein
MKPVACLSLLLLATTQLCDGQSVTPDTAFVTASVKDALNRYMHQVKGEIPLYNGTAYTEYNSLVEEHPYFLSDDWINGTIYYDNDKYEEIPLQFDIRTAEKVITEHGTSGQKIQLISERISSFTLGTHRFIRLEKKETDRFKGAPGFYQVLVEGEHVTLLAKHTKTLQKRFSSYLVVAEFETITKYYFLKEGRYFPVKRKGSVWDVLHDKKNELRQEMKKNRSKFTASREQRLIESARFYNLIKNQE